MNLRKILLRHFNAYPGMEPQDAVKLIYQQVFGCAHMVSDYDACFKRTEAELSFASELPERPAFENIGGGYARLYLNSSFAATVGAETISLLFMESARHSGGTMAEFKEKLSELRSIVRDRETPFSQGELAKYLDEYEKEGFPMVSHSKAYNEIYHPAYRVVLEDFACAAELVAGISKSVKQNGSCVVAIDGRAASGKSTLSKLLGGCFGADVIHMDDFFLPAELRMEKRFAVPGGNVHYERFNNEVSGSLNNRKTFEYRRFDCGEMRLSDNIPVKNEAVVIVEGAYCMHPKITAEYDIKVFMDVDSETQHRRILERNGEEMLKMFESRWIPLEEEYIEAYKIADKCDFQISNAI